MNKKIKVFALVMAIMMILSSVALAASYSKRYGDNTLKRGHKNKYVKNLQIDINSTEDDSDAWCGTPDGIFGHQTEVGVMDYQDYAGLDVDGQAGRNTKTALYKEVWGK
ncbi:MAG: peptidoglycan-binding protein [Clostridia bacterium]|nr:peptidoglycan-binding protein [Clostridia bacterium]